MSRERQQSLYRRIRQALRYGILLGLTGLSLRAVSLRVADSASVKLFSDEEITQLIHELSRAVANKKEAEKLLYRETALRFDEIFADTTCVKANIHFPASWVLFRDAARTLIKNSVLDS